MLDEVTFGPRMGSEEYHARRDPLRERLMVLQQQAKAVGMGTVVLFEGWGSSGKGARISDLVVNLDPRLYAVHTTEDPVGYESRMPFMARFWSRLGGHGSMTIFDQAYYDALTRAYVEEVRHGDAVPGLDRAARDALRERAEGRIRQHIASARAFERQVGADGYLIVRFFLHITAEEQRRRAVDLMLDQNTAWKVDERDVSQMQHYDEYYQAFDAWLERSAREGIAWHVVPALHKRNANVQILQTLVDEMTAALEARGFDTTRPIPAGDVAHEFPPVAADARAGAGADVDAAVLSAPSATGLASAVEPAAASAASEPAEPSAPGLASAVEPTAQEPAATTGRSKPRARDVIGSARGVRSRFELAVVPTLDDARHDRVLPEAEYASQLAEEQAKLAERSLELYRRRIPLVIAYEGWDAAGKGGNIKRVAAALDARSYVVHPVSAPSPEELAHPFLWRFWRDLPRTGHTAIFDRTWYGRVLVERVEGFARPEEWRRAYDEINEFEDDLRAWGAVLVKLWIDVSGDEQLRRFHDRQDDPSRRWKITDEDWRNREKNDLYRRCVNDMLRLTSTPYAPWTVVESDDKRYARVKALKVINRAIKRRLAE